MTYAEALSKLSAGAPEDALTNKVLNRIGDVGDCLTDRAVTPALRAAIVDILLKAQGEARAAIQNRRGPGGLP